MIHTRPRTSLAAVEAFCGDYPDVWSKKPLAYVLFRKEEFACSCPYLFNCLISEVNGVTEVKVRRTVEPWPRTIRMKLPSAIDVVPAWAKAVT